jgi:hypothetical protein
MQETGYRFRGLYAPAPCRDDVNIQRVKTLACKRVTVGADRRKNEKTAAPATHDNAPAARMQLLCLNK